jgi:hypothetical protein
MSELFAPALAVLAAVATTLVGVYTGYLSVIALRAKQRAVRLVSRDKIQMMASINEHDLSPEELDEMIRKIEHAIRPLAEQDRRLLEEGLRQSNRIGAKRYAEEIVQRAHAF